MPGARFPAFHIPFVTIRNINQTAPYPSRMSGVQETAGFSALIRITCGLREVPGPTARKLQGCAPIPPFPASLRITGYAKMASLMLKEVPPLHEMDAGSNAGSEQVKKISLPAEQLTAENFAPFGEVIEIGHRDPLASADGFLEAYQDLAQIDVSAKDGRPQLNLLRATPRKLPLQIQALERYHLSTRTIMPLLFYPFMIIVAPAGSSVDTGALRAFVSDGQQGVNITRGIWQHPLIALKRRMNFITIDRAGPGRNREEATMDARLLVIASI